MEPRKLSFTLERESKNTILYSEDTNGKPPVIGALYVQKWLLGDAPPGKLTVTIAAEEEDARPFSAEDKLWDRILQRTDPKSPIDDR